MTWMNVSGRKLPVSIKPFLKKTLFRLIPIRWRMGRHYWQLRNFLEKAQWWERAEIEAWQLKHLQEIISYAYHQVPGYRTLYDEAGVKPEDIQSLADITILPFTTKELIRDNIRDFTASDIPPRKRYFETTGGSSGMPLGFYKTKTNLWVENAFVHQSWRWAGWQFGEKSSVLRGANPPRKNRVWDFDPAQRELILSSFQLSKETYLQYLQKIQSFKPKSLQAYPSTASQLADLILSNNDQGKLGIELILLGAENIYPWQIDLIYRAFPNAKVTGHYGMTEQVCIGAWCENTTDFHIWPFYGITELIDSDNNDISSTNGKEIVGTSFWNRATPFIRYRTNDLALFKSDHCEVCGRQFDILSKIEGRQGDFVIGHDGILISLTALVFGQHLRAFSDIKNLQFVQKLPGEVLVRVEPASSFQPNDKKEIIETLEKVSKSQLNVTLELTDQLTKTQRGKVKFLEQNLNLQPYFNQSEFREKNEKS